MMHLVSKRLKVNSWSSEEITTTTHNMIASGTRFLIFKKFYLQKSFENIFVVGATGWRS